MYDTRLTEKCRIAFVHHRQEDGLKTNKITTHAQPAEIFALKRNINPLSEEFPLMTLRKGDHVQKLIDYRLL